jgi:predicted ATPase/class 3 adenylate cyclase
VARRRLPTGTVTLLFTDIEGSTRLLKELGDRYGEVLGEHRRILREAFQGHGGVEVDTQGDAFFYAFSKATDAAAAAQEGQAALASGEVRVRIGIHTGEPLLTDEGYIGVDVHRAARICSAAHGGQTILSDATARLVEAELRDLGEQRLKDLDAPQRLYQLGHQDFPPLRTLNFSNLPVPATDLVGRERESEAVRELLREHRLITLVGPGGGGKTRLALQVAAAAIADFKDGVYWVPLAPVREPDLVEPAMAQAVGVTDRLAHHLANRHILLLLDNFEQVVEAAPRLGELLGAAPALKLLVTSREPLQLSGEWDYAVPPLPQTDAVVLFTERARALKAEFEPDEAVAEICRRLDGLPLALELAAARVKVLSTAQMLDRLGRRLDLLTASARDVPTRQRTLRATVDWSYDLLAPEEQELFVRLAVFSGGWTLDAAEAVCDANLDTLESLVAKSLVTQQGERFGMLETLREYALERLEASAECESLRVRHAGFFLALAEEGGPEFERGKQEIWTRRLNAEHDNLRAALQHFTRTAESELELRLVAAIWRFWFDQGLWQESGGSVERALASSSGTTPARVRVMHGAAWTVWRRQGDVPAGAAFAEESLRLSRELGDPQLTARSLHILGSVLVEDDPARATSLLEESARYSESAGDLVRLAATLQNLAIIAWESGDYRGAADGFERAVELSRESGDKRGSAIHLMSLAHAERFLGDYQQARVHFAESLATAGRVGFKEVIVEALCGSAILAAAQSDDGWAGALVGAAQRENDFGHDFDMVSVRRDYEHALSSIREHLGAVDMERAIAAGRGMSVETIVEFLRSGSDVGRPLAPPVEPVGALSLIEGLDAVRMGAFSVVGRYMRFDDNVRHALKDARQKILMGLEHPGRKRNNHLIWAAPGSGKTYFVEQVASSLPDTAYREINLARCEEAEFRAALQEVELATNERALCLIDECDARPGDVWPYEVLLPYLDGALDRAPPLVFVFAGSSGSSIDQMKQQMASRPKGADLLSRIPTTNEYCIEPMSTGDRVLVAITHVRTAARENGVGLDAAEKMALYYLAIEPRLANARQLREFAVRAVERLLPGEDRLKYDHLFGPGEPENKAFWMQWRPYHRVLVNRFVAIAD